MFLSVKEMQERLKQLSFKDWKFKIYEGAFEGPHLLITAREEDSTKPGKVTLDVHTWIPPYETIKGFDMYLLKRLIRLSIHETMEFFKDESGKPLVDPHREYADRDLI